MIGPTLILMIGLVDLVGVFRGIHLLTGRVLVLAVTSVLAVTGLGLPVLAGAVCVVLAIGWMLVMSSPKPSSPNDDTTTTATPRLWPVILLFLTVLGITAYDRTAETATGFLVDAYSLVALEPASSVSLVTVAAAVAVAVFLTRSGNIITLAALGRSHRHIDSQADADRTTAQPRSQWELIIRKRKMASVRSAAEPESGPALKGGRLIGPLERLLIVVLAFSGAPAIIAALAAAKGIVRFPEIAEDRGSGSKAEEFLVGSLASWTLSVIAVLYLNLVHNS